MTRKLKVNEGWGVCPKCHKKLCRVYFGAVACGVELYCSRCKTPVIIELNMSRIKP